MDKTMMNGRDHTGHGWLVEFRQQMTDAGISQTQLAAQLGMTRYVNRRNATTPRPRAPWPDQS